jgi:hypothetical protein
MIYFINKCETKIKNCSGSRKVDQILKVWSLLSPKIIVLSQSVQLKRCTAQTPVFTNFKVKFFLKQKFIEILGFHG